MNSPELGEKRNDFMGSLEGYDQASLVLLGIPMDYTASFRPGSRTGPREIRALSYVLEEYSPQLDRELAQVPFFDAGDLALPLGNVAKSLERIQGAVAGIAAHGKFPLLLGGEHLLTLPAVAAMKGRFPDLAVLHLDAHADLRDRYEGEKYSHATVMRRVAELVGGNSLHQVGIRSGTREEFQYARANTNMGMKGLEAGLEEALSRIGERPLYITLDIDLVDPAHAPGTGTPEPGGCSAARLLSLLPELTAAQAVAFDLVEVAPAYDFSQTTALLAAKVVREVILGCGWEFLQRQVKP